MNALRLRDLGRWFSGGTPPREVSEFWEGDIPWISAKDIDSTRLRKPTTFITRDAAKHHSRVVPANSILLIVRGMALAHGLPVVETSREVAFNQDLRGLVCDPGIEPRYVYYALIGSRWRLDAHIDRAAHGTARVVESIYSERIQVPEPGAQREIADFLDRECEGIDELVALKRQLVRDLDESRGAVLDERLSGVRTFRPLHAVVDPRRPIMYGIVLPGEPVNDGVLLVKGGNVERGQLEPAHLVRVARDIESRFSRARLRAGDILVTIRGSYGAVGQVPPATDGANITQDTARVAPGAAVHPRYLFHALRSPDARRQMASRATGAGVKGVNIFDLRRVSVPVPSLPEQKALATELDVFDESIRHLTEEADAFTSTLTEYRDSLITEAVTGKLSVTA